MPEPALAAEPSWSAFRRLARRLTRRATALYRARVAALATEPGFAGLGLTVTIGLAHGVAP